MADLRSILDATRVALGTISAAAKLPGLSMIPYVGTITGAVDLLMFAYDKGVNIAEHVIAFKDTYSNGVPPQEKVDALNARIAKLRAELHAPMPPKEEGEPD